MSRPSFRPRPIDLNKPLPIIKSSKDLRHEDDVLVSRTLPAMATGMDPAEEEERHLQQALLASVMGGGNGSGPAGRTKSLEIPVPVVSVVPGYDEAPFTQFVRPPSHYIVFDKNDEELERTTVEYDADFTDERFLADLSARAPPGITADALERGMDALEKAQSRSTTLPPYGPPIRALLSPLISSDAARKELHRHWVARRIERGGRSFLRLHQPPVSPGNTDPSVAFRPRDGAAGGGGAPAGDVKTPTKTTSGRCCCKRSSSRRGAWWCLCYGGSGSRQSWHRSTHLWRGPTSRGLGPALRTTSASWPREKATA